ncbi:MAG: homoserine kinase [Magnetococcales bacterium]|nr:homoserine kinase [Magnetococcales bacterium]
MSVYTPLCLADIQPLLREYAIGRPLQMEGISDGVDNSNFFLVTERGRYVLTLVEDSQQAKTVEHTLRLMAHLVKRAIPAPHPVADRQGRVLHALRERPSLIATCLPGAHVLHPTPDQCRQVGELLGRIHLAGQDFTQPRPNPMGQPAWRMLIERLAPVLAQNDPPAATLIAATMTRLELGFLQSDLPCGVCHGDLFPDNVLFAEGSLVGVIDFHYACRERWLYDLAIALVAWGFTADGVFLPDHHQAIITGYQRARNLTAAELSWKNAALCAAALRFLLTRLRDWYFLRQGRQVTRKSPDPFLRRLHFFSALPDPDAWPGGE